MYVIGNTHIGYVRSSNQDALAYDPLGADRQYAVVCDGMGGAAGGNVASQLATQIIQERITEHLSSAETQCSMEHLLASTMAAANLAIYDKAKAEPELDGMGTTVVTVVMDRTRAYISHTGDSRVYLCRGGRLLQLTRDHSVVQEMLESGQLTGEQARSHPRRHFITRALGVEPDEQGEYDELELQAGDRVVLCTDGLTRVVDEDTAAQLISRLSPDAAVDALIQAALDGGGPDNITVVIMGLDCDTDRKKEEKLYG